MQILYPNNLTDHSLLDSGNGQKLERFAGYLISRPEPGAIWDKKLSPDDWNQAQAVFIETGKWRQSFASSPALAFQVPGSDPGAQAHAVQAHRSLPGTGCQLGLVLGSDHQNSRRPAQCAQLIRLYRGRHAGRRCGRRQGLPRGFLHNRRSNGPNATRN